MPFVEWRSQINPDSFGPFHNALTMSHKVVNKSSTLQTLLDDSNRLAPFTLALLDDLGSCVNTGHYIRHLIKSFTNQKNPKHVTVLCLENFNKEKFVLKHRIQLNQNVTLLNEEDLQAELSTEFDLRNEEFLSKLVAHNQPTMDNVLLIDSIVPLFMSQTGVTVETATKNICAWLHHLQSSFSHIVFALHTDFTTDKYLELSLSHFSNVIIDFRLNSGLSEKQLTCPLTKLTANSIHVHIIAKKKHPRTHLKVVRKHEHFQVAQQSGDIEKYLSSDELDKILSANNKVANTPSETSANTALPESTFNLALKKDEQDAKDSLILPYVRKNAKTMNVTGPNLGSVANSTVTTTSSSQIVYHYDQFDDFDEDDPDDDLDF